MGFLTVLLRPAATRPWSKSGSTRPRRCSSRLESRRKLALTLIARGMNPKLPIVVADDSDAEESWLPHAGASRVVLVDDLVAQAMVDELEKLESDP